jgi:hypothetical protein
MIVGVKMPYHFEDLNDTVIKIYKSGVILYEHDLAEFFDSHNELKKTRQVIFGAINLVMQMKNLILSW